MDPIHKNDHMWYWWPSWLKTLPRSIWQSLSAPVLDPCMGLSLSHPLKALLSAMHEHFCPLQRIKGIFAWEKKDALPPARWCQMKSDSRPTAACREVFAKVMETLWSVRCSPRRWCAGQGWWLTACFVVRATEMKFKHTNVLCAHLGSLLVGETSRH